MRFVIVVILIFSLQCCATIFRGYEDTVRITNPPDSLKIIAENRIELKLEKKEKIPIWNSENQKFEEEEETYFLSIPSNRDYVLIFESSVSSETRYVYRKLSAGWFLLDILLIVPAIFDGVTGNWFYYDDIDLSHMK